MRKVLLALYPEPWRDRYGPEMSALLDEAPLSLADILDLVRGAVTAHARGIPHGNPAVRARASIAGVLGCFIAFCAFGSAFAKTTENYDFAEHVHPLLGSSHLLILDAAIVAMAALALAAAPLAWVSIRQACRRGELTMRWLIAVPIAGITAVAVSVALLAAWLHAHHRADLVAWLLLGLCGLCAVAGGIGCWTAPRAIMRRMEVSPRLYALSVAAIGLVALCMALIALATGVYLMGLIFEAPRVGTSGNGPGQLVDVTTSIAIQFVAMLGLSAAAAISARRGLRSVGVLIAL